MAVAVAAPDPGDAFGRLYEYAYYLTGNADDAQDLVHDALVTMFTQIERNALDLERRLEPYLFRTICSLHRRRFERDRSVEPLAEVPETGLLQRPADDPDGSAMLHDLRHAVRQALATLSAEERTLLELAEVRGLTSKEIGAILGKTAHAVDHGVFRARRKFRLAFRLTQIDTDKLQPECKPLLPALSDYLDGRLRGQDLADLEVHLRGCLYCRRTVDDMRQAPRFSEG